MSDEEYEYDYGSDNDYNYGSDDGGNEGGDDEKDELIEIENAYYEGDDIKNENPKRAIEKFEYVVKTETARGDQVKWRFKALQSLVVLHYNTGNLDGAISCYGAMLSYLSSVTRNECTDAINAVLDVISSTTDTNVLTQIYEMTLESLKTANNDRLWFNINLKLARVYLQGNFAFH
jgi:COP9 signalosome complex subunit 2